MLCYVNDNAFYKRTRKRFSNERCYVIVIVVDVVDVYVVNCVLVVCYVTPCVCVVRLFVNSNFDFYIIEM